MSKERLKEYLQSISKDRVVDLCLQFMFDAKVAETQLDQANERLKGAIVPKFKVGQEVYYYHIARNKIYLGLIEDIQYFATRCSIFYRIPNLQRDYFWIREDELFATEQEAQAKLKEIQGNE